MANYSKYFNEAVKSKDCSDFFHPGKSCLQAKVDLVHHLVFGSMRYFLPIFLLPSLLTKFEWKKEFFVDHLIIGVRAVLGGCVPAMVMMSAFCGFFPYLRKHYFQFYLLPVLSGILLSSFTLSPSSANIIACGAVNHVFELILESSKETILYELKTNLMVGTLLFMTLSSTIVYLYKTSPYRPFWLLHVPHANSKEALIEAPKQKPGWMDNILRRRVKICSHQDESCEGFLWQVTALLIYLINLQFKLKSLSRN